MTRLLRANVEHRRAKHKRAAEKEASHKVRGGPEPIERCDEAEGFSVPVATVLAECWGRGGVWLSGGLDLGCVATPGDFGELGSCA